MSGIRGELGTYQECAPPAKAPTGISHTNFVRLELSDNRNKHRPTVQQGELLVFIDVMMGLKKLRIREIGIKLCLTTKLKETIS